jgi:hypothetical protein
MTFHVSKYGPAIAKILGDGQRVTSLGQGKPDHSKYESLVSFNPSCDLGPKVVHPDAAKCCHAGLWLYFDFHDEAHAIAQDIKTIEGYAWHAIIHRREPDPWNSNYWWVRVGQTDWIQEIQKATASMAVAYSTPQQFVGLCEQLRGENSSREQDAMKIQAIEWQILFDHCYLLAMGL